MVWLVATMALGHLSARQISFLTYCKAPSAYCLFEGVSGARARVTAVCLTKVFNAAFGARSTSAPVVKSAGIWSLIPESEEIGREETLF